MKKGSSYHLLQNITSPDDFRGFNPEQLEELSNELRQYLIDTILQEGGHFSANLGVVELSIALHYVFDTPYDRLVWDVGHQAYGHKVLTGRMKELSSIRKKGGLSGFPKISESSYDHFGTGHSSTSISAILGMAEAAFLKNQERQHIAVIGDGSLTGGMAWEALNNLGVSNANVLVVINDNQMGIDPNHGAIGQHLNELSKETRVSNMFRSLHLPYYGPIDGHDLPALLSSLEEQKKLKGPRILHIKTIKGKGYAPAEKEQTKWHSAAKYVKVGKEKTDTIGEKFQEVFGKTLLELALKDERVLGITPAMPTGSSMIILQEKMPHRVFDVGIAEQHAVTFSAGLALEGFRPFCHIYSTFMQRAYDQLIHDVALQNIPVIFCLDRAGVVGEDGATHHGLYDLSYLKAVPNLIVAAPSNEGELRNMMHTALQADNAFAIRYPKGRGPGIGIDSEPEQLPIGKARLVTSGKDVLLLGLGHAVNELQIAADHLEALGHGASLMDMRFLKPLDTALLNQLIPQHRLIVTHEDGTLSGGFGESIATHMLENDLQTPLLRFGFPDEIIEHDSREGQLHAYGLDGSSLAKQIHKMLSNLNR